MYAHHLFLLYNNAVATKTDYGKFIMEIEQVWYLLLVIIMVFQKA